jgi:hypothetical protein
LNTWNPKIPPNTTATARSMITMRLVIYSTPVAARMRVSAGNHPTDGPVHSLCGRRSICRQRAAGGGR